MFDNPEYVNMYYRDRDVLRVIIPNRYLFFDTDGLFIEESNTVLTRNLPS